MKIVSALAALSESSMIQFFPLGSLYAVTLKLRLRIAAALWQALHLP
jgi:hypothetical protein